MKAIILAAGFGERMRPLTSVLPKPLLPLAGVPAIKRIIESLLSQGVNKIIINLHHLPDLIKEELSGFSEGKLIFSEEPTILGTAGGIRKVLDQMGGENFIVINSDIICKVDMCELIKYHNEKKSQCTMVLRKTEDLHKYGSIAVDENFRIRRFLNTGETGYFAEYMFTGVQIMNPDFLSQINANIYCDISKEVYPKKVKENVSMFGYVYNGYWEDIGSPEGYLKANSHFLSFLNLPSVGKKRNLYDDSNIDSSCSLGDGCTIEKSALIKNSILLNNVKVMSKARIFNSIVGPNTLIEEGSIIENRIVATIDHQLIYREY